MPSESGVSLVGAIASRLAAYPPFDAIDAMPRLDVARHVELTYHPESSEILAPASGIPRYLYIINRGAVRVRHSQSVREPAGAGHGCRATDVDDLYA